MLNNNNNKFNRQIFFFKFFETNLPFFFHPSPFFFLKGAGKSELVKQFRNANFEVLDEAFIEQAEFKGLHPQSLLMEFHWIAHWFQRLLKKARDDCAITESSTSSAPSVLSSNHNNNNNNSSSSSSNGSSLLQPLASDRPRIYIADRSPFSAVFYARNGKGAMLEDPIRQQIEELKNSLGIEIYTVCVRVDKEILWDRIQKRLEREPERIKFNEDSREWMNTTLEFYDNFKWDFCVDNNQVTISELMRSLIQKLTTDVPSFHVSV